MSEPKMYLATCDVLVHSFEDEEDEREETIEMTVMAGWPGDARDTVETILWSRDIIKEIHDIRVEAA